MLLPSTAPPPHAKTLEEQKTDFTAEGSPPPGKTGKTPDPDAPPSTAGSEIARKPAHRHPLLTRKNIGQLRKQNQSQATPVNVETAVTTSNEPGAVPSVPMQQAFVDINVGLKDTDRGAESGRTYRKLKD
jgi:hypothetical protein